MKYLFKVGHKVKERHKHGKKYFEIQWDIEGHEKEQKNIKVIWKDI